MMSAKVGRISRRGFMRAGMAGAAAAALGARVHAAKDATTKRPNVIMLLADDHRWDALSCMGTPVIKTPELDRLAGDGVLFENCFVTTSICMSSRATVFTGLYTRCHGITSFRLPLPEDLYAQTYPARLRGAGYRTGFVGKWGLGGPLPKDRFDYFKGFSGQGKYFQERDGKQVHLTSIMGDQAEEFLGGCTGDEPFCLSVSFKAPHVQDGDPRQYLYDPRFEKLYADDTVPTPKTATPEHFKALPEFLQTSEARRRWEIRFPTPEKYQTSVKGYYRLINGVDEVVGRIRAALEKQGLADNTVILYAGDNGMYLGEHGLAGKWFMHEESIRVPLIVYDPRVPEKRKGARRDEMVLLNDVAPTILDFAGLDASPRVQGKSLTPLVKGKHPRWRKEWFYDHQFEHQRIAKNEGLRTERWKYARYSVDESPYEELYDLKNDPYEETNLANDPKHAKTFARMRDRSLQWRQHLDKMAQNPDMPWSEPD